MFDWPTQSPGILLLSLAGLFACHKAIALWHAKREISFFPGDVFLFFPFGVLSNFVLPYIPGVSAGRNFLFVNRFKKYEEYGLGAYSTISLLPTVVTTLVLSDPATIKEVTSSRAKFPKDVELYGSLSFFGRNIVVSEGDEWKKYRKITAPAFSDKNSKLVWEETIRVVEGLFELWDAKGERSITVEHCLDITLPIALFVIGAAGFGQRMTWTETEQCPEGHSLTFKQSLHKVAHDVFIKLAVPEWAMGLTVRTRAAQEAFDELDRYMREMIRKRIDGEKAVERSDLFSSLLLSNNVDTTTDALTERELIGNIFIFLIAGHETTAHTLCFTFALLALYPDEQERLLKHIQSVCPHGNITFADMPKLTRSLAVFNETMRLFPPVTNIPKKSVEDTTLTTTNSRGEKVIIPVPKGTSIALNTAGLHYNREFAHLSFCLSPQLAPLTAHYWVNPHEFKPDRFMGDYPKDAFLPFSAGVRSCLGKKFFETEGIAILSTIISRYEITIKEEQQFANVTFEQRKERILQNKPGITVTPIRVPLVFTKRQ